MVPALQRNPGAVIDLDQPLGGKIPPLRFVWVRSVRMSAHLCRHIAAREAAPPPAASPGPPAGDRRFGCDNSACRRQSAEFRRTSIHSVLSSIPTTLAGYLLHGRERLVTTKSTRRLRQLDAIGHQRPEVGFSSPMCRK